MYLQELQQGGDAETVFGPSSEHSVFAVPGPHEPDDDWMPMEDSVEPCAPWLKESRASSVPYQPNRSVDAPGAPLDADTSGDYAPSDLDESDDSYATDDDTARAPTVPSKRPRARASVKKPQLSSDSPSCDALPPKKRRKLTERWWKPHTKTTDERLASFQAIIRAIDPGASFDPQDICKVCCGRCSGWRTCKPYDIERFNVHRDSCLTNKKIQGTTSSLKDLFAKQRLVSAAVPTPRPLPRTDMPCMGLTADLVPEVQDYLRRTAVPGGGAPTRHALSLCLFNRKWVLLAPSEQARVRSAEAHEYLWLNRHGIEAVFSARCHKTVTIASTSSRVNNTCAACHSVRDRKVFKNALTRPIPDDANRKYVPYSYREEELGELYLKYHGLADLVKKVCFLSFPTHAVCSWQCAEHEQRVGNACRFCARCPERDVQEPGGAARSNQGDSRD